MIEKKCETEFTANFDAGCLRTNPQPFQFTLIRSDISISTSITVICLSRLTFLRPCCSHWTPTGNFLSTFHFCFTFGFICSAPGLTGWGRTVQEREQKIIFYEFSPFKCEQRFAIKNALHTIETYANFANKCLAHALPSLRQPRCCAFLFVALDN